MMGCSIFSQNSVILWTPRLLCAMHNLLHISIYTYIYSTTTTSMFIVIATRSQSWFKCTKQSLLLWLCFCFYFYFIYFIFFSQFYSVDSIHTWCYGWMFLSLFVPSIGYHSSAFLLFFEPFQVIISFLFRHLRVFHRRFCFHHVMVMVVQF